MESIEKTKMSKQSRL